MSGAKGRSGVYIRSENHRKNYAKSRMGHITTEETKDKISKSLSIGSKYTSNQLILIKKARRILNNAVRGGRVKKPSNCKLLNKSFDECLGRIEGHHEDYLKPLKVLWFCRLHHERRHRAKPRDFIPELLK